MLESAALEQKCETHRDSERHFANEENTIKLVVSEGMHWSQYIIDLIECILKQSWIACLQQAIGSKSSVWYYKAVASHILALGFVACLCVALSVCLSVSLPACLPAFLSLCFHPLRMFQPTY